MANPNLINTSSCLLGTDRFILTTTASTIAGSKATSSNPYVDKVVKVVSCYITNITASPQIVTIQSNNPGTVIRYLYYQVNVPANSTLVLITKDSPVFMLEYTCLEAFSGAANSLHATVAYEVYDDV